MIAFVTTNEGKFREVSTKLAEAHIKIVHEDRSYPEIQADRLEKVVRFAATVLDDQIRGDYLIDEFASFQRRFGKPALLVMAGATIGTGVWLGQQEDERRAAKEQRQGQARPHQGPLSLAGGHHELGTPRHAPCRRPPAEVRAHSGRCGCRSAPCPAARRRRRRTPGSHWPSVPAS